MDTGHTPGSEPEGWFGPMGSRRFHWFAVDGRSLCGKYMLLTHPQDCGFEWGAAIGYTANGDCAACKRKLEARVLFRRTYSDQWDGMHDLDFDTPFFATCGYCGWAGPSRDTRREAERDRLRHPDVLCWIRALWIDLKPRVSGEARR